MAKQVTADERMRIEDALLDGASQGSVQRKFHRGAGTVNRIAHEIGLEWSDSKTSAATEARRRYCKEGRLDLIEELFEKVRELLPKIEKAHELKELSTSFGILTDKALLEEGRVTSRSEILSRGKNPVGDLRQMLETLENEFDDSDG